MRIGFFLGKGIAVPHIVKSSAKALQKNGHRVRFIYLEKEKQSIGKFIEDFSPDLIIAIDHKGVDDNEMISNKIPYISWFVDNPIYFVNSENFNEFHYCAVTDKSFIVSLKNMGCKNYFYLPLAGDNELFNNPNIENKNYADLSYVGSFSGEINTLKRKREKQFSPLLNKIFNEAFLTKLQMPELTIQQVFNTIETKIGVQFIEKIGIKKLGDLCFILDMELDSYYKMNIYNELQRYNFDIFGGKDWLTLNDSEKYYKGHISYGPDLSKLYKNTKINIVITRPQIHTGVNQRIFDIPLSCGFFLSDDKDDLKNIFPDCWEEIIYKNFDEMHYKINYYLNNPGKRFEIIKYTNEKINNHHTYCHRMQELINIFRKT